MFLLICFLKSTCHIYAEYLWGKVTFVTFAPKEVCGRNAGVIKSLLNDENTGNVMNFDRITLNRAHIAYIKFCSLGCEIFDHLENCGKNRGIFVIAGDGTPCEYGRNLLH